MKVSLFTGIAAVGLLLCAQGFAAQSGSAEHLRQQWSQLVDSLQAYSVDQRDDAIASGKQALESLDREIENLENEAQDSWQDLSQEARHQRRASLRKLREARSAVAEWYGAMKHGSKETWRETRDGFVSGYNAAVDRVQEGVDELKIDKSQ